jgi:hypothetical protein
MKSQTLLKLYMFWENRIVRFGKPDGPFFFDFGFMLDFLLSWSFDAF